MDLSTAANPNSPPTAPFLVERAMSVPSDLSKLAESKEPWTMRTLACLSNEHKEQQFSTDAGLPPATTIPETARKGVCLLVASAPSHELDRTQQPQPLLELGGVSLVSHALWQLNLARFASVVVVVGFQGDAVRNQLLAYMKSEKAVFHGLRVKFVDLGKGWRGGRVASIVDSRAALQEFVKPGDSVVIVGSDHIFDVGLLQEAAAVDLSSDGDEACVLVELDLEGMQGLPPSTVFCAMRPLHGADRVYSIGTDIDTYSAVEAGLMVFTTATLHQLSGAKPDSNPKGACMTGLLADFASRGTLRMIKTDGRTWFSVETNESAKYTSESLGSCGHEYSLADGRKVTLIGLPRKTEISPTDGGEWAEFSVEKWRSAVYTAKSFFQELFVDTTDFVGKLCDETGSSNLLVEVGCGTGEALVPLFERAKYTCGMDFNPHFIDFCEQNVPLEMQDHVKHLHGDAQELNSLLTNHLPDPWTARPKIVMCVGNTVGIMPPTVRQKVYQEMKDLAGFDGYMVVVYWNGNRFGDAVQHFYHKNPQLCGKFTGECIDLDTCTLTTPSGYKTHWTKPEEARAIFEDEIGVEVIQLVEKGNGVLVAGRMRKAI